jgi:hypothetical protein
MLTIETGSGVPGANSYATVDQLEAYAALRGITLPATDAEKEVLLIRAMDYIEVEIGPHFMGSRVSSTQALAFPRHDVWYEGYLLLYNAIPSLLIEAQCDIAANSVGVDVLPVAVPGAKGPITQEKVGALAVSYASEGADAPSRPRFPKADALLRAITNRRTGLYAWKA